MRLITSSFPLLACYFFLQDSKGCARVQGSLLTLANCIEKSGGNDVSNDQMRYCTAPEMSPLLVAFIYLIQCIMLNEVYGTNNEGVSNKWALVELWESSHIDNGVSYVHDTMLMAMLVNGCEGALLRFRKCPQHD